MTASAGHNRLRDALVVAEFALSLALLVGAGLLFRSFLQLRGVNPGFNPQQVLTLRLAPSGEGYRGDPQYVAYYQQAITKISAVPGVQTVGAINTLPLNLGRVAGFFIEGEPVRPTSQGHEANFRITSPDYFPTVGIPLLQGRDFTARDVEGTPNVAVINQALAERSFVGQNPIGKRISFGDTNNGRPNWFEIIGVVANTRTQRLREDPMPDIYTSYLQTVPAAMSIVAHTAVEPASIAAVIRQAALSADPSQPVTALNTLEQLVSQSVAEPRFNAFLLMVFACLALLLAAAGIYGVMAYSVSQRTHEIGIRLALGAQTRDILRLIIGHGMKLALIGTTIGLIASIAFTRLMKNLLFGVSTTDLWTFVVIPWLLTTVALSACYIPARRAVKVDPLVAVRCE